MFVSIPFASDVGDMVKYLSRYLSQIWAALLHRVTVRRLAMASNAPSTNDRKNCWVFFGNFAASSSANFSNSEMASCYSCVIRIFVIFMIGSTDKFAVNIKQIHRELVVCKDQFF